MIINANITYSFSAEDVKQIILEYVKSCGCDISNAELTFDVEERCYGYGMGEHYEHIFDGCIVKISGNNVEDVILHRVNNGKNGESNVRQA